MRNEYNYPYDGENRDTDDRAAQRRGATWRPGDMDRRAEGRWREDGQGNWRRFQWGGTAGRDGQAAMGDRRARESQEARDNAGHVQGGLSGSGSGSGSGMDWNRSGSMRQGYGDYGHAMDDRRQAQEAQRRNPGNEPNPYASHHHARPPVRNGRPPKGYTRSDERIREDVCEQLMADHYIDAGDVSVEVKDGVVSLSGSVSERNMRFALESVAASCLGVKDVENHVKVSDGRETRRQSDSRPHDGHEGSEAARTYYTAQNYARDSSKAAASSPSSSSAGLTDTSVSDTHGLGGDQSRFIRHDSD